jgi:hypothetical protein
MSRLSALPTDRVARLLKAGDAAREADLEADGVRAALNDLGASITRRPRQPLTQHRHSDRRRLSTPRGFLLAGAMLVLVAGGAAAATKLLTANTGQYAHGWQVKAGGPGEYLRQAAPDFCQVALRLSSDISYPSGYADWRPWVLVTELGVQRVTSTGACDSKSQSSRAEVSTGATRGFFAMSAFCAWVYDWRQTKHASDHGGAQRAAEAIDSAPSWKSVRAEDAHPSAGGLHDTKYGVTGSHSLFGWFLPFRRAVLHGDVQTVDRLIASNYGTAGCSYFKPPATSHGGTELPARSSS